jgi:hypothetical protein
LTRPTRVTNAARSPAAGVDQSPAPFLVAIKVAAALHIDPISSDPRGNSRRPPRAAAPTDRRRAGSHSPGRRQHWHTIFGVLGPSRGVGGRDAISSNRRSGASCDHAHGWRLRDRLSSGPMGGLPTKRWLLWLSSLRLRLRYRPYGFYGRRGAVTRTIAYIRWRMTISFARHQFPPAIIRHAVWLYVRFTLSYRDVEDLLAERDLDVSYETSATMGLEIRAGVRSRASPSTPAADVAMASR